MNNRNPLRVRLYIFRFLLFFSRCFAGRFEPNLWCNLVRMHFSSSFFRWTPIPTSMNSAMHEVKPRNISNKKSNRHRKWFLWTYHKTFVLALLCSVRCHSTHTLCIHYAVFIFKIWAKETKTMAIKQQQKTNFMRSKAFECMCLFANCSFLISLCLWNFSLFFFVFGSCLSCGVIDATVGKRVLVCLCHALHGLGAQFALLQFKLLTFVSVFGSMNLCYFMRRQYPKYSKSSVYQNMHSLCPIVLWFSVFSCSRIVFALSAVTTNTKSMRKISFRFVCYILFVSIRFADRVRTHHKHEFIYSSVVFCSGFAKWDSHLSVVTIKMPSDTHKNN